MRYTIVLAVLLAACGSAPAAPANAPTPRVTFFYTATPTATPLPSATPRPAATAAPVATNPPTATLAPARLVAPTVNAPTIAPTRAAAATAVPVPTATTGASLPASVKPASIDTCPQTHPIKGNRGDTAWIYHLPTDGSYKATHPEECFATEQAAVAAGYRAVKK